MRSTIGLKALVVLYDALLGLGMIIDIDSLKSWGQYPTEIHALAMFTILPWHVLSKTRCLMCLHVTWSGPGADAFEYLAMVSINS